MKKWLHSNESKNKIPTLRAAITTTHLCIEHLTQYIDTDSSDLQIFWAIESTGVPSVIDNDSDKTFLQSYFNSSITCQPDVLYTTR